MNQKINLKGPNRITDGKETVVLKKIVDFQALKEIVDFQKKIVDFQVQKEMVDFQEEIIHSLNQKEMINLDILEEDLVNLHIIMEEDLPVQVYLIM